MSEKLENKRLQLHIDAGIKPGEWQYLSKATLRALVGDPRTQLHVKIYLVGLMHTQGYAISRRQKVHPEGLHEVELAIKLHKARAVPMMPWDISDEIVECTREYYAATGRILTDDEAEEARPSRQHMRRNIELLENAGYAMRATFEKEPRAIRTLTLQERQKLAGGGKLLLYFYLRPRPDSAPPEVANFGYLDIDEMLQSGKISKEDAPILAKIQRVFGPVQLSLFTNFVPDDVRKSFDAIAEAKKALNAAQEAFKQAVASHLGSPLPLRPEKPAERKETAAPGSSPAQLDIFRKIQSSTNDARQTERPAARGTIPQDATTGQTPARSEETLISRPRRRELADLTALIHGLNKAKGWSGPAVDTSRRNMESLFGQCRDEAPDCTPEEVLARCLEKLDLYIPSRGKTRPKELPNPWGMLMAAVPPLFEGEQFANWRQERAAELASRKPPEAVTACPKCGGSGLIGDDWQSIPEAVQAVKNGAKYCACGEGSITRDLVESCLVRSAS